MPLPRNSQSDAICNAALKAAIDPFSYGSSEFDITSGPQPGITWRAVEDDSLMVLQLRTEGPGMSYIRIYEKREMVIAAGFGQGEGWVETTIAGNKVRSPLTDPDVKTWISDLESQARKSAGEDFVLSQGAPQP